MKKYCIIALFCLLCCSCAYAEDLPMPYADIRFEQDGSIYDVYAHMICTAAEQHGEVITDSVSLALDSYTQSFYRVYAADGALTLTLEESQECIFSNGFAFEALLVNHAQGMPSDAERYCIASASQNGFALATEGGAYRFSARTGGTMRHVKSIAPYDHQALTHIACVYNAAEQRMTLYINGTEADSISTEGNWNFECNAQTKFYVGGIPSLRNADTLFDDSLDILRFQLYTSPLSPRMVRVTYEAALDTLRGNGCQYNYVPIEEISEPAPIFASTVESYITDIYEPATNLMFSPTILAFASENSSQIAAETERPATMLFDLCMLNGELHGMDTYGNDLGLLYDLVQGIRGRMIPAFSVHPNTANALAAFLHDNRIGDCFVLSENAAELQSVCQRVRGARPVLDCRAHMESADEICLSANACGAKVVLLSGNNASAECIAALRNRSIASFVQLSADNISALHDAIFSGAWGILTENYRQAIQYCASFTERTLSAPQTIVAHRGDMQNYPQNTLSAFISAAQSGAKIIELDAWMSKDNEIVISHDRVTHGYNRSLDCVNSTRDELETLVCASGKAEPNEGIPFWDEVMEYFSQNYTDIVFTLEIKDERYAVVDRILEITRQYHMESRVLLICMNRAIVHYADTCGIGVQLNKTTIRNRGRLAESLPYACLECAALHSSFYTTWSDASRDFFTMLRHRGIKYSPWLTEYADQNDRDYAAGYAEFTTNVPHASDTYAQRLVVETENNALRVYCVYYDGTRADVTREAQFIAFGNGKGAYRLNVRLPKYTNFSYDVYSTTFSIPEDIILDEPI